MMAQSLTREPEISVVRRLGRMIVPVTLVLACACAAPIGVKQISPRRAQGALTANFLSTGKLSPKAWILLRRANQEEAWKQEPAAVIDRIHTALAKPTNDYDRETRAGFLDVVAELCFAHADQSDDPRYYLAAAFFAWTYLFPIDGEFKPPILDRGNRLAADLYNRGITLGFTDSESGEVILSASSSSTSTRRAYAGAIAGWIVSPRSLTSRSGDSSTAIAFRAWVLHWRRRRSVIRRIPESQMPFPRTSEFP
jgi:hypothetical protein